MQLYSPAPLFLSKNVMQYSSFVVYFIKFAYTKGMKHTIRPNISPATSSSGDSKMQGAVGECYSD